MRGLFTPRDNLFLFQPNDFIRLASFLEGEPNYAARRMFNQGVPFCSLPFFELNRISSEFYRVCKHDGRHRAMVLRDNGYEIMPVRLQVNESLDLSLRIKAQEDAKDPNYSIPFPPHFLTP
tara:strand:+ start:160 stop:522 length:363 start_codon:yes stop_codon:yes gene_type:complete